jgi:arylsulfatase B
MRRRDFLKSMAAGALAAGGAGCSILGKSKPTSARKPNIVIMAADDLGWNDVGYHGGPYQTPHIDRLAREGVELDRFYVCPVCSPTRAGLLTGRYPIRFGMQGKIMFVNSPHGIPDEEETVPEMLARAGYAHRGIIGKWHAGSADGYRPLDKGFTYFYGDLHSAVDVYTHYKFKEPDWYRNEELIEEEGHVTDLCVKEAAQFIHKHAADDSPFFLYLPWQAIHVPHDPQERFVKQFSHLPEKEAAYAGMVAGLDEAIGKVMTALNESGIKDDTFVLFFSDNGAGGGEEGKHNSPLTGHKATLFEGGIRVPAAAYWPSGLKGGRKADARMSYIDMFPTLQAIAGSEKRNGAAPDGENMLEVLRGAKLAKDREFYSFFDQTLEYEHQALNTDKWKLVRIGPSILNETPSPDETEIYLFRIDQDPNEKNNIADKHPEIVAEMLEKMKAFRKLRVVRDTREESDRKDKPGQRSGR